MRNISQRNFHVVAARDGYDAWAAIYDEENNPLIAAEEPRMRAWLGDVRGLRILDLGCGTGRHALSLAGAGASSVGADFSNGMLRRALEKRGDSNAMFVQCDLHRPLPFPDGCFDRVICSLALEHVENLENAFAEMSRVCRRDSEILVSNMHPAMMLAGVEAHFRDPVTGEEIRPESKSHQLCDYVMGALRAGLTISDLTEYLVDSDLIARAPRAAKFEGWPILMMMRLRPPSAPNVGKSSEGARV